MLQIARDDKLNKGRYILGEDLIKNDPAGWVNGSGSVMNILPFDADNPAVAHLEMELGAKPIEVTILPKGTADRLVQKRVRTSDGLNALLSNWDSTNPDLMHHQLRTILDCI